MLTAWAKKIAGVPASTGTSPGLPDWFSSASGPFFIAAKSLNGDDIYICPSRSSPSTSSMSIFSTELVNSPSSNQNGFAFGSGSTPPTENDCTIETQIIGLTGSMSSSVLADAQTKSYGKKYLITLTNSTGASVTVTEVALIGSFYSSSTLGGSGSSNRRNVLLDRTLLAESVTIPDGESRVIEYVFAYSVA